MGEMVPWMDKSIPLSASAFSVSKQNFAWKRGGSTEYFDNLNCDQLGTFDFQNVPNG